MYHRFRQNKAEGGDILFWAAACFLFCLLLVYPFALKIELRKGKFRYFWLPRVFGGWAKPLPLDIFPFGDRKKRGIKKIFRSLSFLSCFSLQRLEFSAVYPFAAEGECIISVRAADIIGKSLKKFGRRIGRI